MKQKTLTTTKRIACGALLAVLVPSVALASGFGPLGADAAVTKDVTNKYQADYATFEEEQEAANALNVEIAAEGMVLLKNKDNALPLAADERGLSLFGAGSYDYVDGGTGSGSGTGLKLPLTDALREDGFSVNPAVERIYAAYNKAPTANEIDPETLSGIRREVNLDLLEAATGTYYTYGDAAIITISRIGGEGADLSTNIETTVAGNKVNEGKHYLELTDTEEALVKYVTNAGFDKVVVLINSSNAMELGELEMNDGIDAILWIGGPGNTGIKAVSKILKGEINPSGKLVDEYYADFKLDPTWYNFGDNTQVGSDAFVYDKDGKKVYDSQKIGTSNENTDNAAYRTLDYNEGIYIGYKYVETVYEDLGKEAGDAWYNAWKSSEDYTGTGVVYPFGYGLSYTTFDWSDMTYKLEGDTATVTVNVKNSGAVAGKDIVQLYVGAPYTPGGIEKAAWRLTTYAKTKLLAPGETEKITMTFSLYDISSFDYNDANNDDHVGYELEAGEYVFSLRSDSHTEKLSTKETLEAKTFSDDNNYFSKNDANNTTGFWNGTELEQVLNPMTREGGLPDSAEELQKFARDKNERFSDGLVKLIDESWKYTPANDETSSVRDWIVEEDEIPAGWTQATEEQAAARQGGKTAKQLADLAGVDYTHYYSPETYPTQLTDNDKLWEDFMNQLTWTELVGLASDFADGVPAKDFIGLPKVHENDGPASLKGRNVYGDNIDGAYWSSEVVIASTWNLDLAYRQGRMVGNDSLFIGVTGWWGPGANTHRSPFGGRNFEYYSQDGQQAGMIAAEVARGAQEKGCITYFKHFALNDQETFRNFNRGILTWVTEQAIRENYLKSFELAVKGGSLGMMSAFNRLGAISCSGSYILLNVIPRGEWGFKGTYVTDAYIDIRVPADMCVRAGIELPLMPYAMLEVIGVHDNIIHGDWDATGRSGKGEVVFDGKVSPTSYFAVRSAAQRQLFACANCNGMRNYYSIPDPETTSFTATAGIGFEEELVGETGAILTEVSLVKGELPKGVSVSSTGVLSGTPERAGTYEFTVRATCDLWVRKEMNFTLTVSSDQTFTGAATATVGKAYTASVSVNKIAEEYDDVEISVVDTSALPAGLSAEFVDEDGVLNLYGTPTAAGEYTFTVLVRGVTISYRETPMGPMEQKAYNDSYETYTVVVAAAAQEDAGLQELKDQLKALQEKVDGLQSAGGTSGDNTEIQGLKDQIKALQDKVAELEKAQPASEGGCGSVIGLGSAAAATAVLLGAAYVVTKRKHN